MKIVKIIDVITKYAKPEFLDLEINVCKNGKVDKSITYDCDEKVEDYELHTDTCSGKQYLTIWLK